MRRLAVCLIPLAFLLIASPAWAHHATVTGSTTCSDSSHLVAWTVTNSQPRIAMNIDSATADPYTVTGLPETVPPGGSAAGETIVPGTITGPVTLTVHVSWPDGPHKTATATIDLPDPCTVTTTSSSTTTEPPTTVPPSSVSPTTVKPRCGGPGELPCTGSDSGTETLVGIGAVGAGAVLVAFGRKRFWL